MARSSGCPGRRKLGETSAIRRASFSLTAQNCNHELLRPARQDHVSGMGPVSSSSTRRARMQTESGPILHLHPSDTNSAQAISPTPRRLSHPSPAHLLLLAAFITSPIGPTDVLRPPVFFHRPVITTARASRHPYPSSFFTSFRQANTG